MKRLTYILLLAATLLLGGCTQNDGNIGDWFGTWRLAEIQIDGQPDESYAGNVVWKFHSDIVSIMTVDDAEHEALPAWGTWSEAEGVLTLNFTYSDSDNPNEWDKYTPPASTHIPAGITRIDVVKLSTAEIVLKYVATDATYTYFLKKHG